LAAAAVAYALISGFFIKSSNSLLRFSSSFLRSSSVKITGFSGAAFF